MDSQTPICPKCDKALDVLLAQRIDAAKDDVFPAQYIPSIAYLCPHCSATISAVPNLEYLATELTEIVQKALQERSK